MKEARFRVVATCLAIVIATLSWSGLALASTLRYVPISDLVSVDPLASTSGSSQDFGYLVYDTLFSLDSNFRPQPQMVGQFTISPNGLSYNLMLRPGLKWHDGTPVMAEDCVASIRRWASKEDIGQRLLAALDHFDVVSDSEFRIVLKRQFDVLEALASTQGYIPFMMPKRLANQPPEVQLSEVIGSGPFIFLPDEWNPGVKLVFKRNPLYIPRPEPADGLSGGKVALVDRIEWIIVRDQQTAAAALVNGEVDFLASASFDLIPILRAAPNVTVKVLDPLGSTLILRMNHLQEPFNNVKARQAVARALRQEDFLAAITPGPEWGRPCRSIYTCGTPYAQENGHASFADGNLKEASRLLKESGYSGRKVVILLPAELSDLSTATLLAAQVLRKIGMNVEVQSMDWATMVHRRLSNADISQGGWSMLFTFGRGFLTSSPIYNPYIVASCNKAWVGWPCDPEMEQLRDAFWSASGPKERERLAREIERRSIEIVPYVPLGQVLFPQAFRNSVHGIRPFPVITFWGVSVD